MMTDIDYWLAYIGSGFASISALRRNGNGRKIGKQKSRLGA
jgi:hypothetical protein